MSGFLVLVGCLALLTLIAIPSFGRANPTREIAAPTAVENVYLKLADIKGEIIADPSLKLGFLDLSGPGCSKLVVVAMRKAGGEQQEFKTNAIPGSKPGTCIYSFKQLPAGTYDFGVQEIHFRPSDGKSLDHKHKHEPDYLKLAQAYKLQKGESAYYLKYGDQFDKWVPAADGGVWLKSAHKDLVLDGKVTSLAGPVLTYTGPTL
jgi:hypothetical protein